MRRWTFELAAALVLGSACLPAADLPIGTVNQIKPDGSGLVLEGSKVSIQGNVTYELERQVSQNRYLFVQDATGGIALKLNRDLAAGKAIRRGDLIRVSGPAGMNSGRAEIRADTIVSVEAGVAPPPLPVQLQDLLSSRHSGRLVSVSGHLKATRIKPAGNGNGILLTLTDGARSVRLNLPRHVALSDAMLDGLLRGGAAQVTGIASIRNDSGGFRVRLRDLNDIRFKRDPNYRWMITATAIGGAGCILFILLYFSRRAAHRRAEYLSQVTCDLRQKTAALEENSRELERACDAALESSRLKSEFLGNVSHELRTPMNGVIGGLMLLLDGELSPEQRDYGQMSLSSAESLLQLIDNVLDLSRIGPGKLRIQYSDFDLTGLVSEAVEHFRPAAERKNLTLRLTGPGPGIGVNGDGIRTRQVLVNLIGNAVKFTGGGTIDVVATLEEMGAVKLFRLSVTDTGVGIGAEDQKTLFHPFTQADGSTRRRTGGVGLGLALSKKLVEAMGGTIGYVSSREAGSTFWFALPLQPAGSAAVIEAEEARVYQPQT